MKLRLLTNGDFKALQKRQSLGFLLSAVWICKEDNASRVQGLVGTALGGRPGVKWIKQSSALTETKKERLREMCGGMRA